MEILNSIWVWVLSILGGLSLSTIFVFVIKLTIGSAVKKMLAKINVEKIAEQATEKGVAKVKKISFNHNIQPLVESELVKINEKSTEVLKKELADVQKKYDNLIVIMEKLSAYFDNSIGVAEEKKADLKNAIANAKNDTITAESVVIDEFVDEDVKSVAEPEKPAKTNIEVER
jgi:hypothetical protein